MVFTAPVYHPPITSVVNTFSSFKHQCDNQPNDKDSLGQSKNGLDKFLVHDNEGAHTHTGGHGKNDKNRFFPGKTHKEKTVMQVVFIGGGQ